jgi:heme A synthase
MLDWSEAGPVLLGICLMLYGAVTLEISIPRAVRDPADTADPASRWYLLAPVVLGCSAILTGALVVVLAGGWIGGGVVVALAGQVTPAPLRVGPQRSALPRVGRERLPA